MPSGCQMCHWTEKHDTHSVAFFPPMHCIVYMVYPMPKHRFEAAAVLHNHSTLTTSLGPMIFGLPKFSFSAMRDVNESILMCVCVGISVKVLQSLCDNPLRFQKTKSARNWRVLHHKTHAIKHWKMYRDSIFSSLCWQFTLFFSISPNHYALCCSQRKECACVCYRNFEHARVYVRLCVWKPHGYAENWIRGVWRTRRISTRLNCMF